ncbi:MAG TPA: ATP-binding protein [Pyrinomonadaceae bacterium]|nr:ATP-binding protein [Pyrinomonadaceae bacterium]
MSDAKINGINAELMAQAEFNNAWILGPQTDWTRAGQGDHFAQFYETEAFLVESLVGFTASGLKSGDALIIVATRDHRDNLERRLTESGVDLDAVRTTGQYVSLDAGDTLSGFMIDGAPDAMRFQTLLSGILAKAGEGGRRVRIFGEMVMLLWKEGNCESAIRLEELWNDLRQIHPFLLFCAYPIGSFTNGKLPRSMVDVCDQHAHVIPAESYTTLLTLDDRAREIIRLQQQARMLQAEIAEREQSEQALRTVKRELEIQVEDLRRLHELSIRLTGTLEIDLVLREVLRAALAVQGTDLGLLSLRNREGDGLSVNAQCGFDDEFMKQLEGVAPGADFCGSYEQRRQVIVEDIEVDPLPAQYREVAHQAGIRSCHSTPLITHGSNILGVLAVYFRESRRPSQRELRLMDLYARMAADFIENAQLHHKVQQELEAREQSLLREQLARAEAESANRMKDEFLATVSHELRTPLNAIIGWSHMLRRGTLDDATTSRALETIERNAKSQAQLIEDLLDVSRVITGKLRLNIGPVDLASVINAAIDSVQLAADSKGIHLEVRLDPSARHTQGDAGRLQQVVWNLLSNAIKFTPSAGHVEVRLERAGSSVQIRVSDTGPGIGADFLPFIFDRFRQADSSSTRSYGGLGLGLAIVRHLVELHGGSVHAESPGTGAVFTIALPVGGSKERSNKPKQQATSDVRSDPLPSLEGLRVLVVDEDHDTLQVINVMLTAYRARVQGAASATEAIEILEWYKPDVIVSDLALPGDDAYSLMNRIRELMNGKDLPAIALTSYVRVEDRTRALSAGFNMFVPKPVQPDELITALANLAEPGRTQ